nr:MAG TPA: hypothetical protein [Caudoviricetes sp.]
MTILANQVRQIKAKKVPIQKSRQLVIFWFLPNRWLQRRVCIVYNSRFFEIFNEEVEVCCEFDVVFPDSFFLYGSI